MRALKRSEMLEQKVELGAHNNDEAVASGHVNAHVVQAHAAHDNFFRMHVKAYTTTLTEHGSSNGFENVLRGCDTGAVKCREPERA